MFQVREGVVVVAVNWYLYTYSIENIISKKKGCKKKKNILRLKMHTHLEPHHHRGYYGVEVVVVVVKVMVLVVLWLLWLVQWWWWWWKRVFEVHFNMTNTESCDLEFEMNLGFLNLLSGLTIYKD